MIYSTQRLSLRKVQSTDIDHIHSGLGDLKVTQYYAVHFPTLESTKEQMDWYHDLEKFHTGLWLVIFDKVSNKFVGAGGYSDIDRKNKKAELGFWLLPEHWGNGYMGEAMEVLFEIGFNQLDIARVEGYVDSENTKCKSAIKKIGMVYEGTMRECEIKNDNAVDVEIYSILKKEWMRYYK